MAAQIRELRQRIRSVTSTGKITKAYELIATSRLSRAQGRVAASRPYAEEITSVLSALASASANLDHPLLEARKQPKRAAVLVVTSDKGMCGAYNANVLKAAEELISLLRSEGKEPVLYVTGRKGVGYFRFRRRELAGEWTGFSQTPNYRDAVAAGDAVVKAFLAGSDDEGDAPGPDGVLGVDEIHVVYTEFKSMLSQQPVAKRIAPLGVEYGQEPDGVVPGYEFEPDPETLLGALLPKYVNTRLFSALLESAASESAARRTAMQAATDNANELVRTLSRQMNAARQAQITQEISEIVGGASALTGGAGSDE
ncbi:F0F1 ATP synthase subunit gamma [Saccharothrix coeruleofusca]|uniref:ATP synthase gamma chain n=1 Tax=Saccharothrix coeruleofusca TaxID=33919 RepID=A0A918EBZ1_9PSEU|nr:F0F1 ATP synthase subunit gamma [Saccharothrix coeruleofusca]MBP2338768.1 F-type H+-transporting ATPase subunit gamma [Saccharothrix coeruleofusca]GGP46092.1 ATP synthase gamma chain [Saccharothrix coeruleofusca]